MKEKTIVITAALVATMLMAIFASTPSVYADTSETNTNPSVKQKNDGSSSGGGYVDNNNCAEIVIKGSANDNCQFVN